MASTFTQTDIAVDPRGLPAVLFRMPVGLGALWGLPLTEPVPRHTGKHGITALHYAAHYGNRRIVRLLIGANAAVNAQDNSE